MSWKQRWNRNSVLSWKRREAILTSIKRRSLFAFLTLLVASACTHQNEGSILVLEGDEKKTCSELHTDYEDADRLSEENIDARKRWLLQLMRDGDCRLPKQTDPKFNFHLTISGWDSPNALSQMSTNSNLCVTRVWPDQGRKGQTKCLPCGVRMGQWGGLYMCRYARQGLLVGEFSILKKRDWSVFSLRISIRSVLRFAVFCVWKSSFRS